MACCSARRVSGRAWDGDVVPRAFLIEAAILVASAILGGLGILLVLALTPVSSWARRQRRRFTAAVTDAVSRSASRVLAAPFLVTAASRCRLSARVYRVSRPIAGFTFRYFNLILFAGLIGVGAVAGVAGLAWVR
jgi:hypothetical protein